MKKHICILLVVALTGALLSGCGAGTADNPTKLATASSFTKWFQADEDSPLSNKEEPGTYYFKLSGDITVSQAGVIRNGHAVVIDLNGHTLSAENAQVFSVDGGMLTLRNGTVESTGANADGGVVAVTGEGGALVLEDVKMSNTDDSAIGPKLFGGVIYAGGHYEKPVTVTLKGTTEINGSASGIRDCGGSIAIMGNSQLYMVGGTVRDGKAHNGGNIYADEQTLVHISGGTVTGGVAVFTSTITGDGGNISIYGQAQMHMAGGTVSGGVAQKNGGNIAVATIGKTEDKGLYQYGGVIEGGQAKLLGGNIYTMEKTSLLVLSGGEVKDGNAPQGGNVAMEGGMLELRGTDLTCLQDDNALKNGGNIYAKAGMIYLYDGKIDKGMTSGSGANIYGMDTALYMYGGEILNGTSKVVGLDAGGGNVHLTGNSVFDLYGGEIAYGATNSAAAQDASTAPNVMIRGTTKMQMFGGWIHDAFVLGVSNRGCCVLINGQAKDSNALFHMYGGKLENDGAMGRKSYGNFVAAYSSANLNEGFGVARIFDGELVYKGNESTSVQGFWGSKGHTDHAANMYLFNTDWSYLSRTSAVGACKDSSHNTKAGEVAATCVTPGYTQYHCDTCGDWCEITAEPAGHNDTVTTVAATEQTGAYIQHSCDACGSAWRTTEG